MVSRGTAVQQNQRWKGHEACHGVPTQIPQRHSGIRLRERSSRSAGDQHRVGHQHGYGHSSVV